MFTFVQFYVIIYVQAYGGVVMFVKKVNRNNDKEMFEFLKEHFTYNTMNSWNGLESIANNVKVYNLGLEGDCWKALDKAQQDDYDEINWMIRD